MKKALASPFLAALIGGVVVAAVFVALGVGGGGDTKTVVQPAPVSGNAPVASNRSSSSLTARDIYKRAAPGVVNVKAQIVQQVESPFDVFPQERRGEASGSGFVVDPRGYILTNAHVIEGASQVTVSFEDKKTANAKVVGRDSSSDLALLKIDEDAHDLKVLQLGDSKSVQVGDPTIAIGNPFGLDRTLTTGVVSALQRRIEAPNGFGISNVIQTDAAINPGNSGGPLLDAAGRVIGINSQIATGGSGNGNVGIGFAVPINTAKSIIPELKKDGRVSRAYLGVLPDPDASGGQVQRVVPGTPAAKAGIRPGDVITKVDGTAVESSDDLVAAIGEKKAGDSATLQIRRDNRQRTVRVTLAQQPSTATEQ
jgi:S1-C subfamily serine protease